MFKKSLDLQRRRIKMYDIIYADPPWEYGSTTKIGNARVYYPTMSFSEIAALNIPSAKNALLFMWIVSQQLQNCMKVAEKWGFNYVGVAFVWHKPNRTLCGYYTMQQTELCLLFKRGKIPQPRGARNVHQFLSEPGMKKHAKPDEIRKRIERMFPTQRKLELFAREKIRDWDVYGNEVKSDIEISKKYIR